MSVRDSRAFVVALVTFATFTDILAYAIAIPVLPDLSARFGASPTVIGVLFGSFGVTLLAVSIPAGAVSDRIGRKGPIVVGLVALAGATLLFAFARSLPWLFAARLVQGAADAVAWVVGFALLADLYGPEERGRVAGIVMSGTSAAVMVGPSIGGWLYELGGIRLPFAFVTVLSTIAALAFLWLRLPSARPRDKVPIAAVVRQPAIASCAAVVVVLASTLSMIEPVVALHLAASFAVGPARIGYVFGLAAVATAILNPVYGRLADRYGARRLTMIGLTLAAAALPLLSLAWSYGSAVGLYLLQASVTALAITPSLAFMGEAMAESGLASFGVAYGLYNMAWGVGLLGGPALGGFLFERFGFARLTLIWGPCVIAIAAALARLGKNSALTNPKSRIPKPESSPNCRIIES